MDQKSLIWIFLRWIFFKKNCDIWNQRPQICQFLNFREKTKMSKFKLKNAFLGYFWAKIIKKYSRIWNQHPQIPIFAKFGKKAKILKLCTKKALFEFFWGGIFEKAILIFEISTLRFAYFQNLTKKKKCLNFQQNVTSLGIFVLEFHKSIVEFEFLTFNFFICSILQKKEKI